MVEYRCNKGVQYNVTLLYCDGSPPHDFSQIISSHSSNKSVQQFVPLMKQSGLNIELVFLKMQLCWTKLCTHCPSMKQGWIKLCVKWLLALIMGICSLWQVWEQLTKFLEGSTTTSLEKVNHEHLPLPLIVLCSSQRYKYDVLADMGLPKNFLDDHRQNHLPGKFPDLNETWLKATWSREDFDFYWQHGKSMYRVKTCNACWLSYRYRGHSAEHPV